MTGLQTATRMASSNRRGCSRSPNGRPWPKALREGWLPTAIFASGNMKRKSKSLMSGLSSVGRVSITSERARLPFLHTAKGAALRATRPTIVTVWRSIAQIAEYIETFRVGWCSSKAPHRNVKPSPSVNSNSMKILSSPNRRRFSMNTKGVLLPQTTKMGIDGPHVHWRPDLMLLSTQEDLAVYQADSRQNSRKAYLARSKRKKRGVSGESPTGKNLYAGSINATEVIILRWLSAGVDAECCRVLSELDKAGLSENTIVVYWRRPGFS